MRAIKRSIYSPNVLLRFLTFLLLSTLWLGRGSYRPAQAHAILVRSDPENGSSLLEGPATIRLEFSEGLDPRLSKARLVDSNDQVIAAGPGEIDASNSQVFVLNLPPLADGAYSVIWQARSVVDGHITTGSVAFSIGQAPGGASLLPPAGTPDPAAALPPVADTLLRWLSYLAASLMGGSLLFGLFVWRPAYRSWNSPVTSEQVVPDLAGADQAAGRRLRGLALLGCLGLILASVLTILFDAWRAGQGAFQIPFGQALLQMLDPRNGLLFWSRLLALSLSIPILRQMPGPGSGSARPWWGALALAGAVLLTFSLRSHGAASGSAMAVALDWIHLAAVASWLGGLLPLFLLLRATELPASILVGRFSRLAVLSVAVLALTGFASAVLHIRTIQALVTTVYGKALILKTVFFGFLILLGATNLLILSPGLRDRWERASRRLRITIRAELALGLLGLLAAGLMTGVPPALEALQAGRRMGLVGEYAENGVRLKLWVAPARVGNNEFAVDVGGRGYDPSGTPAQVLLRLQRLDRDTGITQVEAEAQEAGRFLAQGSYLTLAGVWQIEVIFRRAGYTDIRQEFPLQVQPNLQESNRPNPVPADAASLQAGEASYREYCLPCHGPQGKGDGPAGLALRPPPADLTVHTAPGVHPDGQLFEWITNGYPGSAMPAFEDLLTEQQRWDLVNYIRTLGR